MKVSRLLSFYTFVRFCSLEYGHSFSDLLNTDTDYLYFLMNEWYQAPLFYSRCYGKLRKTIEKALKEGLEK